MPVSVVRSIASFGVLDERIEETQTLGIRSLRCEAAVDVASSCRDVVDSVSAIGRGSRLRRGNRRRPGEGHEVKRNGAAEGTHGKSPEGEEEEGPAGGDPPAF